MRRRERDRPLAAMPLRIAACIAAMSAAIIGVDAGVTAPALVTSTNTFDFTITPDWTDENVVTAMRWGLGTSAGAVDAQGLREIADLDAAKTGRTVNGTVEYKATFNSSVTRLALVPGTGYYVVVEADYTPAGGTATKKNASSVKVIADDTPPALVTLIPNLECDVNGVMTVDAATPKPDEVSLLHARLPNSQASPQASRTNDAESAALITDAIDSGEDLSAEWGLELCWKFDEGESWVTDYSFAIFTSPLSYYDPSVAVSNATGGVSRGRRLLAATTANVYRTFGQTASTQASVRTTSQLSPWESLGSDATRLKVSQRDMITAMRTNAVDADAGVEINGYVAVHIRATNAAGLMTEVSGPEILIPPQPSSSTAEGDSMIYGIIAGLVVVFTGVLYAFYREMRRQDKTAKEKERQQLLEDGSRQMNLVLRALASDRDDDSLLKGSDSFGVASGRRSRRGSVGSEDLDLESEEHRSGSEDWRGRDGGGIHRRRNVIFVCTDMEGSTAMAAENAELYQEVQDKHDEVLSSAALAHNGYIFATQGDAFELVFPTIGDAVRFCLEGQEALLRTQWSSEALDLPNCGAHESKPGERAPFEFAGPRVRMGIHAASLASRGDGGDEDDPHDRVLGAWDLQEFTRTFDKDHGRVKYDGPAVVMTRVIGDCAAGGQVVLSETAVAEFERHRASCDFAVLSDLGKFQFTELTAGTLGSRTGAAGKRRKQQTLDDDDGTAGDARPGHRGRGKDKHVVSRLHELQPPTFSYLPLREFPPMLRGTVKLDVGHGLDFPKKPSIRAASRRGDTVVMARVHGIRPSKWAEVWLTSNFQQVMDRHVCALLQLFGGVPLIQDADIPSHTYALCFPAASAAVRFSMALQVSLLYGTWDNDVLENSVRPYYSRSGQLLARGPTVACMVITLDENDGEDIGDMCRQMDYYDERGVPEKGSLGLRMTEVPAPPPFAPPSVPNALRGSLHGKGHHAGDSEANNSGRGLGSGAPESSAASDDSSTIGGGNLDSSVGGGARSSSSATSGWGGRFLAALGVSLGTQKSAWHSSSDDQTKTLRHVFAPGDPVRYSNFSDAAKLPRFETLMRTIYPGQVSVTADTWLSVQHALPEGVSPVDLGAHKLRCRTVMVEPCNGVRFDSTNGGGIMDSLDGGSGDEGGPVGGHGAARRTASMTTSSHEIRVDFEDDDVSDGADGDATRNAEYDVSLYNVSHRILHERAYPPLRSVRCTSPGYYDSPRPGDGVAIVFCKPRLPKNLNSGAAEEAKQRWASIARALLPVYSGYECKSPETGQFTLAFARLENAIGFCTNAQAMMSQFAARDDSGGWPKELLDAEAKEAADAEAAVRKEREEARAQGLKKVNFVTDTAQLAAHQAGQRGLRVAMGIAYGVDCFRKPLLETGRADYFGPLANLAARVMSSAHGGQVLVEGVPLLWKDKERFRGSVHWFPNDPTDADSLKERERWCERSKTAVNTMMGTFNVPWYLVVNAGKAATQMLLKELDAARSRDAEEEHGGVHGSPNRPSIDAGGSAGEPALHLLHNLRATLEQRSERDIGAWIRQGGVGGLDMETGASESALALCTRGFCELKGFPQITPLVEARSPSLKPAKFPAIRTQREPVLYEKLADPKPPRAWAASQNAGSTMDRSSKYYGGAGSKLASIVLGMTSSGHSQSRRGGKAGSKWNVVRDAVEGSASGRSGSKFTRRLADD